MRKFFALSRVLLLAALVALVIPQAGFPFSDDPIPAEPEAAGILPRVLIIGDSISIGYTPEVKFILASKAEVKHNPGNAQHTGTGLAKLDDWLGDEKWAVIHFNWGLWDLCYRAEGAGLRRDKESGKVTFSIEEYRQNLEKLVLRLKKTRARLIWASTTMVPEGEAGRKVGDDRRYNAVAEALMKKYGIPINDLNKVSRKMPSELFRAPGDVHFKPAGRRILAERVAAKIEAALASGGGRRSR